MKLYNSGGPNPHMVRIFMAEKGMDVPRIEVDLRGGGNRRAAPRCGGGGRGRGGPSG